ncbi:MAG: hypothetical protein U9O98_10310 [Asgard group archaeon]|nr:hypothetical protein [Asgard group archaeon]
MAEAQPQRQTIPFKAIEGTIVSVNRNDWGIRGRIEANSKTYVFVIQYDKIDRNKIPVFDKGDILSFSNVYISDYKGKCKHYQGLQQAKACKNGTIRVITSNGNNDGTPETEKEAGPKRRPANNPPQTATSTRDIAIEIDEDTKQAYENLEYKLSDMTVSIANLREKMQELGARVFESKVFQHHLQDCSLKFMRIQACYLNHSKKD